MMVAQLVYSMAALTAMKKVVPWVCNLVDKMVETLADSTVYSTVETLVVCLVD